MEAKFYIQTDNNKVKCELCPHNCEISDGNYGICNVRENEKGKLITRNYGVVSSMGFDPIEKKPLYHFYPGSEILSVGSLGCNLKCKFCQNWQISQCNVENFEREFRYYSPQKILELTKSKKNNVGIAYTYNEPTIFYEFMLDTAILAKESGLNNVMVSNGFINKTPLKELLNYIDAFNIDLKAFSEDFYKGFTKSRLEPVKDTLLEISKAGKHLEITNLVIPTLNDDEVEFENMIKWIADNLGKDVVLHISRYYPSFQLDIEATSVEKMLKFNEIANRYLNYVYLGNLLLPEGNNTYCPQCNELSIRRSGYSTKVLSINNDGNCMHCGYHILNYN